MKRILMALVTVMSLNAQANEVSENSLILTGGITYAGAYLALQGLAVTTMVPLATTIVLVDGDLKVVAAAKDDAAFFIANEGEFKSAVLEQALQVVRQKTPDMILTDLDIALAILAM